MAEEENKSIFIDWADLPSCVGCVSLENTTYPEKRISDYINERFISVQLNQRQFPAVFEENKIIWTPTISVCDATGEERDRWIGYLPPGEFLPRIKLARARLAMFSQDYRQAADVLNEITVMHEESITAADALYWHGVTRWKISREHDELSHSWTKLMQLYPKSEAALKASCLCKSNL
jgi:thioredoxin-related protein